MFSGIIEEAGTVKDIRAVGSNIDLTLSCSFANELHLDQSLAHNGVCLTVTEVLPDNCYKVTAIRETLDRSNLGLLKPGMRVNLERSMKIDARLDGHIVQGHVDTTARVAAIEDADGSRYITFDYADRELPAELVRAGYVTVEKGSVTVNGVSLTVCDSKPTSFRVALIPFTLEITNLGDLRVGDRVNLEFDIVGKYIARLIPSQQ